MSKLEHSSHIEMAAFFRLHHLEDERARHVRSAIPHLTSYPAFWLLQQGLEADPPRGKHLLYANRSGANLTLGRKDEALQDANCAAESAPADFSTAYIRQVHP